MSYLNDEAHDQGLDWVTTNGTQLDICSTEPASYAEIATYSLGSEAVTVGVTTDGATDGRRVSTSAIATGAVTATGTAGFWALSNGSDTLVSTNALNAPVSVTTGQSFSLPAISITKRDP